MKPNEIREYREARGMSRADFATMMGVTRMTVHNWEVGRHPMSAAHRNVFNLLQAERAADREIQRLQKKLERAGLS